MDNNDQTYGVSLIELARYLKRHLNGVIIYTLIVSVLSGGVIYALSDVLAKPEVEYTPGQNVSTTPASELDDNRKAQIDKYYELYNEYWQSGYNDENVPSAQRTMAGYQVESLIKSLSEQEREYFNEKLGITPTPTMPPTDIDAVENALSDVFSIGKIILLLGFGMIVSCGYYTIKCVMSKELLSVNFFRDRYQIDYIPWSDIEKKGFKSSEEVAELINAIIEGIGISRVFITGTEFGECDSTLAQAIERLVSQRGIEVVYAKMDPCDAQIIRNIKNANIAIVVEHVPESKVDRIDEEMRAFSEYHKDIKVKAILTER